VWARQDCGAGFVLGKPVSAIFFPTTCRAGDQSYLWVMKKTVFSALIGLLLAACAPSTPQTRIQREPEKFEALGKGHQALVQDGRIERGMSPDAVYLAWGPPSRVLQGAKGNQMTERWDYAGSRPVYYNTFYGSYGRWYGPYRRHGYYGAGWAPEVAYIPYRIGTVWFVDNRVDSWERAR
jgi:hypothetical protein